MKLTKSFLENGALPSPNYSTSIRTIFFHVRYRSFEIHWVRSVRSKGRIYLERQVYENPNRLKNPSSVKFYRFTSTFSIEQCRHIVWFLWLHAARTIECPSNACDIRRSFVSITNWYQITSILNVNSDYTKGDDITYVLMSARSPISSLQLFLAASHDRKSSSPVLNW